MKGRSYKRCIKNANEIQCVSVCVCIYIYVPHVGVASLCRTCPVSQGSGGGVLANDEEEHRAIENRSIEQRSKPAK